VVRWVADVDAVIEDDPVGVVDDLGFVAVTPISA
jgi:hypothetical protein